MKLLKRYLIPITICLILTISSVSAYAATSGAYEYNDFSLYSVGGTLYRSGVFRSNNSYMETFTLTVNVYNNTWTITGGTTTNIPFPSGTVIEYTDNATFLQSAYVMQNGVRKNFSIVSGSDTSGNFYCTGLSADPYYYPVSVYLPTTGESDVVPSTPILSVTNNTDSANWLSWTPTGYTAEVYLSDSSALAGDVVSYNATSPFKISEESGYYYIRLKYYIDGVLTYTDYSNRVYGTFVDDSNTDPPEENTWQKILHLMENVVNGIENATSTISSFIESIGNFIQTLVSWLPSDVSTVFFAVVIIGLVLGLFLK